MKRTALIGMPALFLALLGCLGVAQQTPAQPRFGVVSIKIQSDGYRRPPNSPGPVLPGGKYVDRMTVLWKLIVFARPQYAFPEKTIVGLPDWAYALPSKLGTADRRMAENGWIYECLTLGWG